MKKLIERLEKATGPDRQIDNAIEAAVDFPKPTNPDDLPGYPPYFTASYDAARTLVPEGFYWLVSEGRSRDTEPLGGAQVFRPTYLVEPIAEAEHESAIIALCIAALRARTQAEGR